jgi:competence protein ComEC
MVSLVELAHLWHRQPISLNSIAAAAVFILAFRPTDLFSVSFQLSFASVTGILLLEPHIRRCLPLPAAIKSHSIRYALNRIRTLITVSLAAQLAVLPITLYYFHETANYFMLATIFVLPLTFLIVTGALAMLTLGWLPLLGKALAWTVMLLTKGLNSWVSLVENLPGAVTEASPTLTTTLLLYAIIAAFAVVLKYVTK